MRNSSVHLALCKEVGKEGRCLRELQGLSPRGLPTNPSQCDEA